MALSATAWRSHVRRLLVLSRGVDLGGLQGVLIHAEAEVEDARIHLHGFRILRQVLAACQLTLDELLCRAMPAQHLGLLRGECGYGPAAEQQVVVRDASAARQDSRCGVIGRIAVEVAARAVLTSRDRRHLELQVQVVAPAVDREGDAHGQLHVHDATRPQARRLVGQLSLAVVCDGGTFANLEDAKFRQDRLAIHQDAAAVRALDGLHFDLVAVQEGAGDHNLLRRGQTVGVLRAHVAALDLNGTAVHDPVFAVSVEAGPGTIEGNQVRVTPEKTRLALRRRRRRRHDGCPRSRNESVFHYHWRRGRWCLKAQEGDSHDRHEQEADDGTRQIAALVGDQHGQIARAATHVLVGRLSNPIATARADIGQGPTGGHLTHAASCVAPVHAAGCRHGACAPHMRATGHVRATDVAATHACAPREAAAAATAAPSTKPAAQEVPCRWRHCRLIQWVPCRSGQVLRRRAQILLRIRHQLGHPQRVLVPHELGVGDQPDVLRARPHDVDDVHVGQHPDERPREDEGVRETADEGGALLLERGIDDHVAHRVGGENPHREDARDHESPGGVMEEQPDVALDAVEGPNAASDHGRDAHEGPGGRKDLHLRWEDQAECPERLARRAHCDEQDLPEERDCAGRLHARQQGGEPQKGLGRLQLHLAEPPSRVR
mmetsp:Transcript_135485/g.432390  ORF Transcript_135485/g.432390 Transcript_135485/m.432390 type:complete len:662 (+) Transcript_135485:361-2346(+)